MPDNPHQTACGLDTSLISHKLIGEVECERAGKGLPAWCLPGLRLAGPDLASEICLLASATPIWVLLLVFISNSGLDVFGFGIPSMPGH